MLCDVRTVPLEPALALADRFALRGVEFAVRFVTASAEPKAAISLHQLVLGSL